MSMPAAALPRFVLASASPARAHLLRSAGLDPEIIVSGVDESVVQGLGPRETCATLARLKAQAVASQVRLGGAATTDPAGAAAVLVLGCDSVLEFDGEIHGKPVDDAQAAQRWRRLRGHSGILHTGHCLLLVDAAHGDEPGAAEEVGSTEVRFARATDEEIDAYVRTGEPSRVAGAFTLDGIGAWFLDGISGDAGNVVGVSLPLVRRLLHHLGLSVPALWHPASERPADALTSHA